MAARRAKSARPSAAPPATPDALLPRRTPAQQRSRERLGRILAAARDLIARKGSDQVKMSEIAGLAGISIGSLYQYFPEKAAIVRALAERYSAESRKCIEAALSGVRDRAGLRAAYEGLLDQYYALFLAEPVMRDIWSGMQADKHLMALELAESRACGALLAAAIRRVYPDADPDETAAAAFLIWQLGEAAIRLAISLDRAEGDAVVEAFKRMTVREILRR
jgi:AcrR family transcriptional regulator